MLLWILFLIITSILLILIKKEEKIQKYKKIILFSCFLLFLLLLFFTLKQDKNVSFDKYKNTSLENQKQVEEIISLLDIKSYKEKIEIDMTSLTISLNEKMSILDIYQKLEKNSLILFSLIMDVEEIHFERKNIIYHYYYEDLNTIMNHSLRGMNTSLIKKRYENDFFKGNGIYMGTIAGYEIIDESTTCEEKAIFLQQEENSNYYLKCSDIESIYLYKDNEKYPLNEKIEELEIKKLLRTNLNIIKENASQ